MHRKGASNQKKVPPSATSTSSASEPKHSAENAASSGGFQATHVRSSAANSRQQPTTSFYEEYLSSAEVSELVASGRVVVGHLHVSPKRRKVGYVTCSGIKIDVCIPDERTRNRGIHGDLVAVLVAPEADWLPVPISSSSVGTAEDSGAISSSEQPNVQYSSIQASAHEGLDGMLQRLWKPKSELLSRFSAASIESTNQPSAVTTHALDERASILNLQPVGKIVHILSKDRKICQMGALVTQCQLTPNTRLPMSESYCFFHPAEQSFPNLIVPRLELPASYIDNPALLSGHIFMVDIVEDWPVKSKMPYATNVRSVGESGSISAEVQAALLSNQITHGVFTDEQMQTVREQLGIEEIDGVTSHVPWQIPESEIAKRLDLRNKRIFTIDPSTAKDLDDAVHIEKIGDDLFSIGVHIADVSYFLPEGSALDIEARRRATSVYLVQKVLPMLPPILCEQLCSLNPNVDRLAFSCIWKMRGDGSLLDEAPWFGRTVIRSCAKLDYITAQRIIDGIIPAAPSSSEDPDAFLETMPEDVWESNRRPQGQLAWECARDVLWMHDIAVQRRETRMRNGAVNLQNQKLMFVLDPHGNPTACDSYKIRDSNRLIEEYMLMANYLVAEELIARVGGAAFLRRHPQPDVGSMDILKQFCNTLRLDVDFSSSSAFQASLKAVLATADESLKSAVNALLILPLKLATYVSGHSVPSELWWHYGLSIPYYTHFTSPIRRYADIVVHRLLDVGLTATSDSLVAINAPEKLAEFCDIASNCNDMKLASKKAQERCDRIYLAVLLAGKELELEAIVIGVGAKSFTVLDGLYGLRERIFLEELVGYEGNFQEHSGTMTLRKRTDLPEPPKIPSGLSIACTCNFQEMVVSLLVKVRVRVTIKARPPIDVKLTLVGPWE